MLSSFGMFTLKRKKIKKWIFKCFLSSSVVGLGEKRGSSVSTLRIRILPTPSPPFELYIRGLYNSARFFLLA